MRKPKTEGYQWLEFSFIAFNGSGYANRNSAEEFVQSYIDYNRWKRRPKAVKLAQDYYQPLLLLADYLIDNSFPEKQPSEKGWAKFQNFIK